MRALTWQGRRDVRVDDVPDPRIEQSTDAIIKVTSTAICGSDLHLYEVLGPFLKAGDVLGHETMGIVEEVGSGVKGLRAGDRVVVPFNISCGSCWMCSRGLYAQCETTQVREHGKGASLFGYTELYGSVPGGQAEYLRVPQAHFGPIKVPEGLADERFLYLSDILPTAWQAVAYADVPAEGTLAVLGLGPVGQLCARIGKHLGHRVIGVDRVTERLELADAFGVETVNMDDHYDVAAALVELTAGRGADGVVDAVGMEAHGSPFAQAAIGAIGHLPGALARPLTDKLAIDRLAALRTAVKSTRRGGTVSVSGVYGGEIDPMPVMEMFDRGITMRLGQCHVRRWTDDIIPLLQDSSDPLAVESLATHRLPLAEAPRAYEMFQKKQGGCIKVVLKPVSDQAGQVVVVTGASSGIGLAIALRAAGDHHHVVLVARGPESLAHAERQCWDAGAASVMVHPADVSDSGQVETVIDATMQQHGRVDAVVHSAGVVAYGRFEQVPTEVFDQVIATNLLGSANVARAVLSGMRERDSGTLVLVGSVIGHIAAPHMSAYAVSKWGVRSLARHLQIENRDRPGVHVAYVSPGGVDTPIYLQAANYLGHVGRPPPPVASPDKVALAALRQLDRPRPRVQVGLTNRVMMAGFTALPAVFDALVTPLFSLAATDPRHGIEATSGNVRSSRPQGNRLHGNQGNAITAIAAAVTSKVRNSLF